MKRTQISSLKIIAYVQGRKSEALRAFEKESKDTERHQERQDFETLVNQIILYCLWDKFDFFCVPLMLTFNIRETGTAYALTKTTSSKGKPLIVPLEFTIRLRNGRVPISDVYSALGELNHHPPTVFITFKRCLT